MSGDCSTCLSTACTRNKGQKVEEEQKERGRRWWIEACVVLQRGWWPARRSWLLGFRKKKKMMCFLSKQLDKWLLLRSVATGGLLFRHGRAAAWRRPFYFLLLFFVCRFLITILFRVHFQSPNYTGVLSSSWQSFYSPALPPCPCRYLIQVGCRYARWCRHLPIVPSTKQNKKKLPLCILYTVTTLNETWSFG